MNFLYTSDIHASPAHLAALLAAARRHSAGAVVVGGDIVPHDLRGLEAGDPLAAQTAYLEKTLIPALAEFQQQTPIPFYLDLGNDDFAWGRRILERRAGGLLRLLHNQKHRFSDQLDIIGYMTVPPTPFVRKDWEKPDAEGFPCPPDNPVRLDGVASGGGRLAPRTLDPASADTIENDLAGLSGHIDRPFIFVSHSPPYGTPLDLLDNGVHVGSRSIRRFIETWARSGLLQASLHGHIHGAPARSGRVQTRIGGIPAINPGQNEGPGVALRYALMAADSGCRLIRAYNGTEEIENP